MNCGTSFFLLPQDVVSCLFIRSAKSCYNGWTWSLTWNCSKNKPSAHQLLSFNSSVDQQHNQREKWLHFFTSEVADCKSGSVILPTTLTQLSGLSLRPDDHIFQPSFCLMNFQSVRPSISILFLVFLPHSCSFSIIYGLFQWCYPGFGWGLDGGWGDGGWAMGDGWFARFQASWNIHVCVPVSVWEWLHVYPHRPLHPHPTPSFCVCVYSCL